MLSQKNSLSLVLATALVFSSANTWAACNSAITTAGWTGVGVIAGIGTCAIGIATTPVTLGVGTFAGCAALAGALGLAGAEAGKQASEDCRAGK